MKSAKWIQAYRVGARVEVRVYIRWIEGVVIRKTAAGYPVVELGGAIQYVPSREKEIRLMPLPAEPLGE